MGVGVPHAGEHEVPGGVDHLGAGGGGQPGADRRDAVALDQDVGAGERGRRADQDLSSSDQQSHRVLRGARYFRAGSRSLV